MVQGVPSFELDLGATMRGSFVISRQEGIFLYGCRSEIELGVFLYVLMLLRDF